MLTPKIKDYIVIQQIGYGKEGRVYLVESQNKQPYAIKTIEATPQNQDKIKSQASKNISLKHQNIVVAYECFFYQNNTRFAIVLEYCPGGTLASLMKENQITQKNIQTFISQIAQGLEYLHQKNIIHRDIKPQNILIKEGVAKIADLGFAKNLDSELISSNKGSLYYQAPETLENLNHYELKSDLYSFGIVVLEMCLGKRIFKIIQGWEPPGRRDGFPPKQLLKQIKNEKIRSLVVLMLKKNPEQRLTASEVLNYLKEDKKVSSFSTKSSKNEFQMKYLQGCIFLNLSSNILSEFDRKFVEKLIEATKQMDEQIMKQKYSKFLQFLQKGSLVLSREILQLHNEKMKEKEVQYGNIFRDLGVSCQFLKFLQHYSKQALISQTQLQRLKALQSLIAYDKELLKEKQVDSERAHLNVLKYNTNSAGYHNVLNMIYKVRSSFEFLMFTFNETYRAIKYLYDRYHSNQQKQEYVSNNFVGYSVRQIDSNFIRNLKKGDYIQSLGFIPVSKKRQIAQQFMSKQRSQGDKVTCLLVIEKGPTQIDPKFREYDHGFVDINTHEISNFPEEQEIFINALNILRLTQDVALKGGSGGDIYQIHLEYGVFFSSGQKQNLLLERQKNAVRNSRIPPDCFRNSQSGICQFQ